MLGMRLAHPQSGVRAVVDGVSVDPAGVALVRLADQWFRADECVGS